MADHKIYVAADDSWGDAHNLRIVKVTDEQIAKLNEMNESEALDFLRSQEPTLLVLDSANVEDPYDRPLEQWEKELLEGEN